MYVQFVKYTLLIVFMLRMLYKNSKHTLTDSYSIRLLHFSDDVIEYLLYKHFLC